MVEKGLDLFPENKDDMLVIERGLWSRGYKHLGATDEVGRGCVAGPACIASVIFPEDIEIIPGLTDSKKLTERRREGFIDIIREKALAWSVVFVSSEEIDQTDILSACLRGMSLSIEKLLVPADFALVDGNQKIPTSLPQQTVVSGDARSMSIAAASILAKVVRDRYMVGLATRFPEYGFEKHKGYGTKQHLEAIRVHGPTPFHRKTFKGVKEFV